MRKIRNKKTLLRNMGYIGTPSKPNDSSTLHNSDMILISEFFAQFFIFLHSVATNCHTEAHHFRVKALE